MTGANGLEWLLRRDRAVVLAGLAGVVVLAWLYLLLGAGMPPMPMDGSMAMPMAMPTAWSPGYFVLMLLMWAVMMLAMMLPSAAPMILLFATIGRRRNEQGAPYVPTAVFALGYAIVWAGFSLAATTAQWGLQQATLVSPMTMSASARFGGLLLIAAGLYQLTPLKHACLRQCRSPLDFVLQQWREGVRGALAMGLRHGLYCVGCCWALMLLLFVGGVMNLVWIAAIATFVLLEKLAPGGVWLGRAGAAALLVAGAVLLLQP